jgi:hypothetical protein
MKSPELLMRPEARLWLIAIDFQLRSRMCHCECPGTSALRLNVTARLVFVVDILAWNINTITRRQESVRS